MSPLFTTILALAATTATVSASSISEYYYAQCGGQTNTYRTGNTPVYCNTQQGQSIGYTLDSACAFYVYNGVNCAGSPIVSVGKSKARCVDFPGSGKSWKFVC